MLKKARVFVHIGRFGICLCVCVFFCFFCFVYWILLRETLLDSGRLKTLLESGRFPYVLLLLYLLSYVFQIWERSTRLNES